MEKDDDCIQSTGTLYGSLVDSAKNYDVIPAQAGIQSKNTIIEVIAWIPAFAGMTELDTFDNLLLQKVFNQFFYISLRLVLFYPIFFH